MIPKPAIRLEGVSLACGGREVLAAMTLSIGEGELIGVLGPNGAGKTTLMRAILGLLAPRAGRIEVLGGPTARGNPAIGYLPQARAGLSHLRISGRDIIASALDGHRLGLPRHGRAVQAELDRVLALVGAGALARRPVGELSGGERQRLLFAQALLGRPRLLLLDEPLISLDPRHQRDIVDLAARLRDELGITILFSAHEINPLLGAIDRVLYLGGGEAALGTVEDVITAPVLSRLYGAPIEVVHLKGRIFVLSGGVEVEHHAHCDDHHDAHAGHHHAPSGSHA